MDLPNCIAAAAETYILLATKLAATEPPPQLTAQHHQEHTVRESRDEKGRDGSKGSHKYTTPSTHHSHHMFAQQAH